MTDRWLTVIGIGADGMVSLAVDARTTLERAEVLVGGSRHLSLVPAAAAERIRWERPISKSIERIAERRGRRVVVIASGDPMEFGIGAALCRRFDPAEIRVIPAPGSVSLACARLLWPRESVAVVSLCGRPIENLALHLAPDARLVVLAADGGTPAAVARFLADRGFGSSPMRVYENLGGENERVASAAAATWREARVADLNVVAVECRADASAPARSRAPGLPDDAFAHDGQITKRELRALAISALAPLPGQTLWDIGAGCGSVAIEWMRAVSGTEAVAIERKPERAAFARQNATVLGVPDLEVVVGEAPAALAGLDAPDAVFVGGGVTRMGVLDAAWAALNSGGRLVAHAVSIEGEARLAEAAQTFGGRLTRVGIERAEPLGGRTGFRPARAVTQLVADRKSGGRS
jgi:precorrin-6Y C5,15-methyltransferase (decarboxylating)